MGKLKVDSMDGMMVATLAARQVAKLATQLVFVMVAVQVEGSVDLLADDMAG